MEDNNKKSNKKVKNKKDSTSTNKSVKKKNDDKKVTKKVEKKELTKTEEVKKEELVVDKKIKKEEDKKEVKQKVKKSNNFLNKVTLEQITIGGIILITILLIVLIVVAAKDTKTKDGKDIVAKINGKTITADELYKELKTTAGRSATINMIDEYILNKEYKTTDDMKQSAEATIENYKNTYGDNYQSFLEYNGIKDNNELKELLIKNSKLSKAVESYIKENLTESEMKKYYDENIVGDIKASHILISFDYEDSDTDEEKENKKTAAKEKAESLIERIKNGEDFATLAKENSTDEGSKENGGDLGYFNKGQMVTEFEDAAFKLKVDEYTTEPVESEYGYHIIMKTGEKEKPSYKKAKDTVIEKLVEEKKDNDSTINDKTLIALRKKYKLNIKDDVIKKDYNDYIKNATTTTTVSSNS